MFPASYSRAPLGGGRGIAAGISAALHVAAFIALVHAPAVKLPRPSESEYRQSFAGKEEKIVWYKFRRELPKVAPPRTDAGRKPLRAENRSEQAMVATATNAPKRPRMVWTPAPAIRNIEPLESPNLVAVKLPPPPVKPFTEPVVKQVSASAKLADPAPRLAVRQMEAAAIPEVKLAPKPFAAPAIANRRPVRARIVEADAPSIAASMASQASNIKVTLAAKPFTAPPQRSESRPAARISESDAPTLSASKISPDALPNVTALPPKPFTAPSRSRGEAPQRSIASDAAPPVVEANARDLNLAVVGLNPLDRPLPPPSSSPADFSAGKQLRRNGASAQGSNEALSVPGLYVGKPREKAAADLLAQAYEAPTSAANLRAAMRSARPIVSESSGPADNEATSHSGAVRVSSAPEARFEGRDVFMMAIQMPNLTSYSGSWLMWYADRTQRVAGLAPIAPPVPHRKVDPKYIASAVADRIEGKVRLGCVITKDGRVSGVELLRGLDDRLNRSAEEALAKWEFYPATRNGQPVDVDVVVEIPFRLEPLPPKP